MGVLAIFLTIATCGREADRPGTAPPAPTVEASPVPTAEATPEPTKKPKKDKEKALLELNEADSRLIDELTRGVE